ncbi:hypothetical protein V6N12_065481 [Hibiscus sabdariffa]|uniref:RNase H type-1 domain-containing protein n=1 Tax=Hibiscus sabdariffa TaxID=183260 RepID=A0ABR2G9V0_9ROSI
MLDKFRLATGLHSLAMVLNVKVVRNLVHLEAPPQHWCKVNVDGARSSSSGMASCGGVVRDVHGKWLIGFYPAAKYLFEFGAEN